MLNIGAMNLVDLGDAVIVTSMDSTHDEYICRALDHARLGINRSELSAKARAIHASSVAQAMVSKLQTAGAGKHVLLSGEMQK